MAPVAVRTGPVSADDSARDVNPSRWLELTLARRTFVAINVPYDCRSLINFVDEAASHRIWEHTGHADLDDYIHHGLDIDPELVEWARLGLSVIGKEKPIGLDVAVDAGRKAAETMAKAPNDVGPGQGFRTDLADRKAMETAVTAEAPMRMPDGKGIEPLVNNKKLSQGSSNTYYLAARLKRDHPEIAARVANGEFKSIRAAALEAGIVKPMRSIQVDTPEAAIRALLRVFTVTDLAQALGKAAEVSPPS